MGIDREKMMKTICVLFVIAAVACAMPTEKDVEELGDSVTVGGWYPSNNDKKYNKQTSKACASGESIANTNNGKLQCATLCYNHNRCVGFVYKATDNNGHKCRLKASCSVTSVGSERDWYEGYAKGYTRNANKACPTTASGMSDTNDKLNDCAKKCNENSNCGGFVLMDAAGSSKCRFKASSCTQSTANHRSYWSKNRL